ncbi:hypothetical protein MUP38_07615 [Candidatus Bathyarchaeota archaeon]|nr:hypothetical protein [Candidatus Bathyarchaeota archaeon]
MSNIERKKVSILLLDEPNFEEVAFKYLVVSLNKIQSCFEFEFPEIDGYPFNKKEPQQTERSMLEFLKIVEENKLSADFFIGIIKEELGGNLFFTTTQPACPSAICLIDAAR